MSAERLPLSHPPLGPSSRDGGAPVKRVPLRSRRSAGGRSPLFRGARSSAALPRRHSCGSRSEASQGAGSRPGRGCSRAGRSQAKDPSLERPPRAGPASWPQERCVSPQERGSPSRGGAGTSQRSSRRSRPGDHRCAGSTGVQGSPFTDQPGSRPPQLSPREGRSQSSQSSSENSSSLRDPRVLRRPCSGPPSPLRSCSRRRFRPKSASCSALTARSSSASSSAASRSCTVRRASSTPRCCRSAP